MCHIQGNNCLCPCPVCHVPHEELKHLAKDWDERTMDEAQAILDLPNAAEKEKAAKKLGLRPLPVYSQLFSCTL